MLATPSTPTPSPARANRKTVRWIVFAVGPLQAALPIVAVQRVIRPTQVYGSGLTHFGLTHVGPEEVTVVDLHQKLLGQPLKAEGQPGYLVIVRVESGDLLGVPVSSAPELMDVPCSLVRQLPAPYRQADTLAIASQVAVVPTEADLKTIFLLDTDRLLDQ